MYNSFFSLQEDHHIALEGFQLKAMIRDELNLELFHKEGLKQISYLLSEDEEHLIAFHLSHLDCKTIYQYL